MLLSALAGLTFKTEIAAPIISKVRIAALVVLVLALSPFSLFNLVVDD